MLLEKRKENEQLTDLRVWIEQSLEKENLKLIPSKKHSSRKSKSRASSSAGGTAKKSKTHHSRTSSSASKNRELNSRDLMGNS